VTTKTTSSSPGPDQARLRELAAAEAQHIGGFRRMVERFDLPWYPEFSTVAESPRWLVS